MTKQTNKQKTNYLLLKNLITNSLFIIIIRDTPTSAGPNSFGKTKQGFCDSKKVFEKSLKAAIEKAAGND